MYEKLYEILNLIHVNDEQEMADKKLTLDAMELFDNMLNRENVLIHFSSSPWIINKENTKTLMIYHNIYKSWGWCGGHADGNENLEEVAIQEGKEETGLKQLHLFSEIPLAIDVLPVPAHIKNGLFVSAHIHIDLTYLCIADERDELHYKPDENSGVMWLPQSTLYDYVSEKNMLPIYEKLMKKTTSLYKI